MNVPDDLHYSAEHEWARRDGDRIRIGITDYAQDALGDVVFVQLPSLTTAVSAGGTFSEVESTKSVSDIYSPVDGVVATVNEALSDNPALLNDDPYGDGWICEIEMTDPSQFDALLDADAYRRLIEG